MKPRAVADDLIYNSGNTFSIPLLLYKIELGSSIHQEHIDADLDFDENHLIINNEKITFSQETNIENIDWKKFDVDYVFECRENLILKKNF